MGLLMFASNRLIQACLDPANTLLSLQGVVLHKITNKVVAVVAVVPSSVRHRNLNPIDVLNWPLIPKVVTYNATFSLNASHACCLTALRMSGTACVVVHSLRHLLEKVTCAKRSNN